MQSQYPIVSQTLECQGPGLVRGADVGGRDRDAGDGDAVDGDVSRDPVPGAGVGLVE